MAKAINSQVIFITTSPRTPEKMIPEIDLLIQHFNDQKWNSKTQRDFMKVLRDEEFFNGKGEKDPAFSARDRINRAPKSLGFITLNPKITLTPAGKKLINSKRKDEIILRQLLKFQVPSPYHKPSDKAATFNVKPYLEMLRLVRTMGTLKFDELQIFGMQLTDWNDFPKVVHKIEQFRIAKAENKKNYKTFKNEYLREELCIIYSERIANGDTKTRESNDRSLDKFLRTQSNNMRDYADACFRYLHVTGLVNVSHIGKSLSIVSERIVDVDYILQTIDRNPCFTDEEVPYVTYLGDASLPILLTDNKKNLIERLHAEYNNITINETASVEELKDLLADLTEHRKAKILQKQVTEIKDYKLYDDIQNTYKQIVTNKLYDAPLMLEWNTWRAMTMLDGGSIKANFNFDDFGKPLSTAQGNMADIVCDYDDYMLTVEVTMASGQKQYEMESEPVSRHLGKIKKQSGKPTYCLFVAPTINEACIAHFFGLHHLNISYYGGKSTIIPLPLNVFQSMLESSYEASYTPNPTHILQLFEQSNEIATQCDNENGWYEQLIKLATNWLRK